jgi:hypothetical protein
MKLIILVLFILISIISISQNHKGIAFQAIARSSQGIVMGNQKIQIRISILTDTIKNSLVYQEIKSITTNSLGLFSVLIGANELAKIKTEGVFDNIKWGDVEHFIRVEIDPENHFQFIQIGQQAINYVAYSFTTDHIKSENIEGIISVAQGGTGFSNLTSLKQAMLLDKVNNIADSNKVISKPTSIALNNKLEKKDTVHLSNRINQKINIGAINQKEIETGLGFMPFEFDFGAFYDTSKQVATVINTAVAINWKDTSISNKHIYIGQNTALAPTRLTVLKSGVYFVQYTIQASNALISNDEISIWIRRNGAAYPNSLRQTLTGPTGTKNILSGQGLIPLGEGDYIELFFSVRNIQTQLIKTNILSNPSRPATPSAQISIIRIQ